MFWLCVLFSLDNFLGSFYRFFFYLFFAFSQCVKPCSEAETTCQQSLVCPTGTATLCTYVLHVVLGSPYRFLSCPFVIFSSYSFFTLIFFTTIQRRQYKQHDCHPGKQGAVVFLTLTVHF